MKISKIEVDVRNLINLHKRSLYLEVMEGLAEECDQIDYDTLVELTQEKYDELISKLFDNHKEVL